MSQARGEIIGGMATIGFIGSGMMGGTLARLSVAAGHMVVLSNSRGPDTLKDLVAEIGSMARAESVDNTAEEGDLVVVATPLAAVKHVPVRPLEDKAVIDANNYYPQRDGPIADLDSGQITSSQLLQRHLPGASVVKAFNNIFYKHLLNLARPAGDPLRSYLPIAGDNDQALLAVANFLSQIGYGVVDYGPLAESWRQQPGAPVYGAPYGSMDSETGRPAGEGTIRAALAAASR
jgi:8-hydroxy-5-deazaflavin:NADPH oxidoreductase